MFSLDVAVWKGKRSEHEAALKKAKQRASPTLPRVVHDKKIKQIYGKTPQEMYESYLARVDRWMHDAPAQSWTASYDKESYSKAYVPRERHKDKDLGGPAVKIGLTKRSHVLPTSSSYSPRGVYKGGGKCVRRIVDPRAVDESAELPRDVYKLRIANFEKTREKHKELHPPMMIPKNKPLTCGKYFVQDVICCSHASESNQTQAPPSCRKCAARCASPERSDPSDERSDPSDVSKRPFYRPIHSRIGCGESEPAPTAEYVASPQWRVHSPHKWLARDFASTVASSTAHTATVTSITGQPYCASVLIADKFAPRNRGEITPTPPTVHAFEHERRAKTAALALQTQRSPHRTPKTYFTSMWTEPPPSSPTRSVATESPVATTRLGGRDLVLSLREHARTSAPAPPSPQTKPSA